MKCNKCGKEFDFWDTQEEICFIHNVGYGSKRDGEKIKLRLCCDCFDEIADIIEPMCVISPVVNEDGADDSWRLRPQSGYHASL